MQHVIKRKAHQVKPYTIYVIDAKDPRTGKHVELVSNLKGLELQLEVNHLYLMFS